MTETASPGQPTDLLAETTRAQSRASDPTASAWVSANAGAGKTHVLMMRVLRLLLAGTDPQRILCLTFTKAAAAEMANRVFRRLAEWAVMTDDELEADLSHLLARPFAPDEIAGARQLFARAIETPGGLKVQTIHAFCEQLLQRFPLEAGIPPGFTILDEQEAKALKRDAIDAALVDADSRPDSALGKALAVAVRWAIDDRFDEILETAVSHRDWLKDFSNAHTEDAIARDADAVYRRLLNVRPSMYDDDLVDEMTSLLSVDQLAELVSFLSAGSKTDVELSEHLSAAARATGRSERVRSLHDVFLTKNLEPRSDKRFITKKTRAESQRLTDVMCTTRDTFHALAKERAALHIVEASVALVLLAERVLSLYTAAKTRRAALDYDDLIEKTASLLAGPNAAEWVLYKLDGGLEHILVDEAQDTSPTQWTVIKALAAEFFTGDGARDAVRTIFAVGDEKQSIYGFQGAAPEQFSQSGHHFSGQATGVGQNWHHEPLQLSFRTVAPLLNAVDTVFADPSQTPGLGAQAAHVRHIAHRIWDAGRIEIWETEKPEDVEPPDVFAPLEDTPPASPVTRLANRIAGTIGTWLSNGTVLESSGRPIRASDVLILVRKRRPFADTMVRALKAHGIPVAGADRLVLADQIAIQDLMALGDFLTLPEDDLALAVVLKSPLFDLSDDDLLSFAPNRKGSLWTALLAAAKSEPRLVAAAETLKRWRALADFTPPFEFFANLLDHEDGRRRFLNRLGPDAADAIDEFINLALAFDDQAPVSLQGFLSWLREGNREIKRDMEQSRNEVRVMTVHGAKGLEAPIVFLPDTCSAASSNRHSPLAELRVAGALVPERRVQAWAIRSKPALEPLEVSKQERARREQDEHNRLLYVAMTRARDRLYIAGYQTSDRPRGRHCWYDTICDGLKPIMSQEQDNDGRIFWHLSTPQEHPPAQDLAGPMTTTQALPPPAWASTSAPYEPQLAIPMAPSRLAPLDTDEAGEPQPFEDVCAQAGGGADEAPAVSPRILGGTNRFLRGMLTHALLEHLPHHPAANRRAIADRFIETRGQALPSETRVSIVEETLAVLQDPEFADVFGRQSRAEVSLVAEIPPPGGKGLPLKLSGQIDRLVQRDHDILILDYKTNRPPPRDVADVADAYLMQLAAYRLALQQIYPARAIRAAFLWTDGCHLMTVPDEVLDAHQLRLWALGARRLDAA